MKTTRIEKFHCPNLLDRYFCGGGEARTASTVIDSCRGTWLLKQVTAYITTLINNMIYKLQNNGWKYGVNIQNNKSNLKKLQFKKKLISEF